jgi:hypothetical protein
MHNGLTKAQEERLTLLIEEASEIIYIACKIKRFGFESKDPTRPDSPSNREYLFEELKDLTAVLFAMQTDELNQFKMTNDAIFKSWERKRKYLKYQKELSND